MGRNRKLFFPFAVLSILAVLALACTNADVSRVEDGDTSAPTASESGGDQAEGDSAAGQELFAIGDAIQVDDGIYTVTGAEVFTPTNQFDEPEAGKTFYMVSISIENAGDSPLDFNPFNYMVEDASGVQVDAAWVTDVPNELDSGSLAPGGEVAGNIVFEVPEDLAGLKLIFEPNVFLDQQIKVVLTE